MFPFAPASVQDVAQGVDLLIVFFAFDMVHLLLERHRQSFAHLVQRHRLVGLELLHERQHRYGLADVDDQVAVGVFVVVEVDAGGHDIERCVTQLTLRLTGDAEHALDQRQQLVSVVVSPFGHHAQRHPAQQHLFRLGKNFLVLGQTRLAVADAVDGQNLQEGEESTRGGFLEYVGARQKDDAAGQHRQHGHGLHQGVLMAGGDDVGTVFGQVLPTADDGALIMTVGGYDGGGMQQLVADIQVLYGFLHEGRCNMLDGRCTKEVNSWMCRAKIQ